ncbi:hypothetical protein CALCODRAFT_57913 [Calocera cornea HHB12733]|uniref:Uncharacterized protein n=1 Tax=Calocera cornea HHB12733 TaxID=1353952 RepID=A0A165IV69_9BASI|nr:hypothetical protein CALCODRAFT_57913 [Calocera cornea HHB12733]
MDGYQRVHQAVETLLPHVRHLRATSELRFGLFNHTSVSLSAESCAAESTRRRGPSPCRLRSTQVCIGAGTVVSFLRSASPRTSATRPPSSRLVLASTLDLSPCHSVMVGLMYGPAD